MVRERHVGDRACTAAWPTSRSSRAPCSWRSATMGVERSRRHGPLGTGRLHHPAARGLVLVRAPRRRSAAPTTRRSARSAPRPELGGMVRDGHAERVADLTVAIGQRARASRVTSSGSSRPPRSCTTSVRSVSTNPTTAVRPNRLSVAQAGATILRGTQLLAPAGDIIAAESMPYREPVASRPSVVSRADPQGRECVRRAVATVTRTAPGSRSKRCAPRRTTSTTRGCSAALEIVLDRRGLLDDQLVLSARPAAGRRRAAAGRRLPSKHRSTIPSPITMSPIENC